MKKGLFLLTLLMLLTNCSTMDKGNTSTIQKSLTHHNYLLINVNGQTVEPKNMNPRIEFGEALYVSGSMCNSFAGQGRISGNTLKVSDMVRTQAVCLDEVRNNLDIIITEMLVKGATVSLQDTILTLSNGKHTLTFMLQDWVY